MADNLNALYEYIRSLKSVAVAYSSGVDSTFLLKAAKQALGKDSVIAVTVESGLFPERELEEAKRFCQEEEIRHIIIKVDPLEIEGFKENPSDRCYICKRSIFARIIETAKEYGMNAVAEGSNIDDLGDYRPGLKAIRELGVKSPLKEASMDKAMIRELSKEFGLNTWSKPSFACIASRFVYGEEITREKLAMVDKAEELLYSMGFSQFRVRIHDRLARIEVLPDDFDKIMDPAIRKNINESFRSFGFAYVTMDLQGYRTGSMNETL